MDFRNLAATRTVARPPKKRSQEQVSGRPGNRQRYHRRKARLTKRPNLPYAHLPPEEIVAHQRNNRCGGGDQQKHLRGAGKPIDSAALTHSYCCRQYHKEKLEELGKHLPIENLEKHRCIVAEVAGALQDQDVVKGSGNTKDTDGQDYHQERAAAKSEDPPREAPDKQAGRPGPAREREI
jgi:hypothetical protein